MAERNRKNKEPCLIPGKKADRAENRRQTGSVYEQAAGRYLERKGWKILEYNYRCRAGEIDLIALDGKILVFCEVKYRSGGRSGNSLEAVDRKKQQKIFQCAMFYLAQRHIVDCPCRFDVIGTDGDETVHVEDAFRG